MRLKLSSYDPAADLRARAQRGLACLAAEHDAVEAPPVVVTKDSTALMKRNRKNYDNRKRQRATIDRGIK